MEIGKQIKNYCSKCFRNTNHNILYFKSFEGEHFYEDYTIYYSIVECAGCNRISYRTEQIDVGNPVQDEYGEWGPSVDVHEYPKVLKKHRYSIRKHQLPAKIGVVYDEAIKAFASECYLLTGAAFRAVIEAICLDKAIAGRDLNAKIINLAKSKLITEIEADRLHPIRFMGNDSIHEMTVPSTRSLYIVLSTVDHLLNNLYIIDAQIKQVLETVISNFEDLKLLLDNKLSSFNIGDCLSLRQILGKSYRRLNNKVLEFETELQLRIDDGTYLKLSKGDVVPNIDPKKVIQNYIIVDNTIDEEELPF